MPWQDTPHSAPHDAPHTPSHEPSYDPAYDVPHPTGGRSGSAPARTEPLPGPGRAERRRAAAQRGRRGKGRRSAPASGRRGGNGPAPARPLSRVEARRAAREAKAAKDSVGVVVGELFITLGV
ncbi:class E sortase, partial [Streptomyces sp. NPDC058052]